MSEYSGQLGIVLLFDHASQATIVEQAKELAAGNAIDLERLHIPHLTLYHSKFKNLSEQEVHLLLEELAKDISHTINFTTIEVFWDKFVFWTAEKTKELEALHEHALTLSTYFDPEGVQQSDTENIILTEEETVNVSTYGNPLVGSLWKPHATIGYFKEGIERATQSEPLATMVSSVALVRIGEYGTAKEILAEKAV